MLSRTANFAWHSSSQLHRRFSELSTYANFKFRDSIPTRSTEMNALRDLQSKLQQSSSAANTAEYYEVSLGDCRN